MLVRMVWRGGVSLITDVCCFERGKGVFGGLCRWLVVIIEQKRMWKRKSRSESVARQEQSCSSAFSLLPRETQPAQMLTNLSSRSTTPPKYSTNMPPVLHSQPSRITPQPPDLSFHALNLVCQLPISVRNLSHLRPARVFVLRQCPPRSAGSRVPTGFDGGKMRGIRFDCLAHFWVVDGLEGFEYTGSGGLVLGV